MTAIVRAISRAFDLNSRAFDLNVGLTHSDLDPLKQIALFCGAALLLSHRSQSVPNIGFGSRKRQNRVYSSAAVNYWSEGGDDASILALRVSSHL